jgi:heat shock protein HslJ
MRLFTALACCALGSACASDGSKGDAPPAAPGSASASAPASESAPAPASASGMPVFDTALIGSIWLAEDIGGTGVVDNLQSKLQFVSPTQVAGHAGCNSFSGTAVLTTAKLSIGPLASTRKMCPPAVMDQENRFLRTLETVHSARVENDLLYLRDGGGQTVVRLSRTQ